MIFKQPLSFQTCRLRRKSLILFLAIIVVSTAADGGRTEDLAVSRFELEGLSGWTQKIFKGQTDYRLQKEDGRIIVQATSHAAASGLIKEMRFNPSLFRYLRWSWKIKDTIKDGTENTKAGDDYAARLYVVFPGRFFWQTKAINYIWANHLPKGKYIPNAYTGQAMMVAVQSGPALTGRWINEERNIWEDFKLLFGEEPKEASAIAIMTDTDNTGMSAVAWYGNIVLSTSPRSQQSKPNREEPPTPTFSR